MLSMLRRFERIITAFPKQEPNQPPKGLLAFCWHYSRQAKVPLLIMSITTACIAIGEVALFGFLGQLVDWLTSKNPETFFEEERQTLMLMGGLLLIGLPLMTIINSLIVHQTLLGNYPMSIRWLAHRYLLKQSLSFYQNDFAGRIGTKVMQTALSVRETVMKALDVMLYIAVYFISMIFVIAQADSRLVIPVLVWMLIYIGIQLYFIPKLKAVSTVQADARALMTGRLVDSYTNIATVKLFSHDKRESDYAQEGMSEFLETVHKQMRLVTGVKVCVQVSNYILVFTTAALALMLWQASAITAGAIAITLSLAIRLNGMSQWIMWELSALFENIGTVIDGMSTLAKPLDITDQNHAQDLNVPSGQITWENTSFHYGKGSGVIEGLNLNIKPGEKLGVVGRSGAGKSTLVNLLLRFHNLEGGRILIDGQDIAQVTQESLRQNIGMVTQDTSLLHRTVRENITYGKPGASESELIDATHKAEAHEFIQTLSDIKGRTGYDAQVGERGVKLSGGQRQRIAIARVLLKDAPILILDEATSALDSEAEAAIQESLYELMQGKTVIAIAHRLSTIAAMDRLIVMDKGAIVEQGSHQELIQQGGIYADLWAHQTGGFLGESETQDPEIAIS